MTFFNIQNFTQNKKYQIWDQKYLIEHVCAEIINDTSKFLKFPSDPTIGREGKLQRFLRTLNKKGFFSKELYENIYPSGSQSAGCTAILRHTD